MVDACVGSQGLLLPGVSGCKEVCRDLGGNRDDCRRVSMESAMMKITSALLVLRNDPTKTAG